jgi:hypothetical protein
MATETLEAKAVRLLAEGRLTILVAERDGKVIAECRGLSSGETHKLGWDPSGNDGRGRWGCTCDAHATFHRHCSHLRALQLVVTRKRRARP